VSEAGDNKEMADYILGHLPEAEEARLEAQYLADPRLQDQLLFVEDELVDDYVHGRLSTADRAHLETRFLASPRGRRKLEFVNSLVRIAGEEPSQEKQRTEVNRLSLAKPVSDRAFPIRRVLAAVAALLFVLILGWSFREKLLHGFEQAEPRRPGTESPSLPGAGEEPTAVSILLEPTARNVDHSQRATIPPGTQEIDIQVEVGPALHASYRVALADARDQVKWRGSDLKPRPIHSGNVIDLHLPASTFESGEYTLLLSPNARDARPIAEYVFVIEKR
jgi:hypothetical protein